MRKHPGAKRKAPITLPTFSAVTELLAECTDPRERVQLRTLRLKLHATPNYARTPVGALHAERARRVLNAGGRIQLEAIKHEDGTSTGLERRRIVSELEHLARRGTIGSDALAAAQAFQRIAARAAMGEGSGCMSYAPRFIDAEPKPELFAQERAVSRVHSLKRVYRAVPKNLRFVLDWLRANVLGDEAYSIAARRTWPELTERMAKNHFRLALKEALEIISSIIHQKSSNFAHLAQDIA